MKAHDVYNNILRSRIVKLLRLIPITVLVLNTILLTAEGAIDTTKATMVSAPVRTIVCMIWQALINIAGALAGLIFVYAGVRYIASADDPQVRKAAKDTMMHCLIGLIIIAVADNLIDIVAQDLKGCE